MCTRRPVNAICTNGKHYTIITNINPPAAYGRAYFVRSGHTTPVYGIIWHSGIKGYDWSSRTEPSDAMYAYDFGFGASDASSSSYNNRYGGFPLRCLAS